MLELHNITIGQHIKGLSAMVSEGQVLGIMGGQGTGKTTLLRALLGFIPIDEGHISIDGELMTPLSAPWFRKQMAYVPQYLVVPEGYEEVSTDYMRLLEHAAHTGKRLLMIDEPREPLSNDDAERAMRLIKDAAERGAAVVAVNAHFTPNQIQL